MASIKSSLNTNNNNNGDHNNSKGSSTTINSSSNINNNNLNGNRSSSNNNNNSGRNHKPVPRSSIDYLQELLKDKRMLSCIPNVFIHIHRLLDAEIDRVRAEAFHNTEYFKIPDTELPNEEGEVVSVQKKVFVPVKDQPSYNFVGRLLGPAGMTAKQLEKDLGCKIMIRGKGSMRDKKKEEQNRGKPNWEHLDDELHVLISVEDTPNRAEIRAHRAAKSIQEFFEEAVRTCDGEDETKRKQLMELALMNGTYRDLSKRRKTDQELSLVPDILLDSLNKFNWLGNGSNNSWINGNGGTIAVGTPVDPSLLRAANVYNSGLNTHQRNGPVTVSHISPHSQLFPQPTPATNHQAVGSFFSGDLAAAALFNGYSQLLTTAQAPTEYIFTASANPLTNSYFDYNATLANSMDSSSGAANLLRQHNFAVHHAASVDQQPTTVFGLYPQRKDLNS